MLVMFAVMIVSNSKSLRMDIWTIVLVLFSCCYVIFDSNTLNSVNKIVKIFLYPMCYLVGLNFVKGKFFTRFTSNDTGNQMKMVFVVAALGPFVHYLLNFIFNFDSFNRNTIDVWTGELMSATGQAILAFMAIGFFVTCLWSNTQRNTKLVATAGIIIALAYNLVLAGRTMLILFLIVFLIGFIYRIKQRSLHFNIISIVWFGASIVFLLILYHINFLDVRTLVHSSNLIVRLNDMTFLDYSRVVLKKQYYQYAFEYPWGGGHIYNEVGRYAHGLFLDAYNDVGIIGCGLLIIFVVVSVVNMLKVLKWSNIDDELKLLIVTTYIVMLVVFFMEPVLQGVPWLFCIFCFFSGLIQVEKTRCSRLHKNKRI